MEAGGEEPKALCFNDQPTLLKNKSLNRMLSNLRGGQLSDSVARGHWLKALRKVQAVTTLMHVKPRVVEGTRLAALKERETIQTVNAPSSKHGPAVRVTARLGVHGDTVGRDYEAPNVNLGANPHKLCRPSLGRMSAAAIGRACAEIDATARSVSVCHRLAATRGELAARQELAQARMGETRIGPPCPPRSLHPSQPSSLLSLSLRLGWGD